MNAMPSYLEDGAVLRIPPHSVEAEQSVLGGLMLAPEALREVRDLLKPTDFYRGDHQLIFEAICDLAGREQPFDTVLLMNWFENAGKLERIGDGAYLIELASTTPSAANIRAYAEVVRNKALLRGVIEVGTEVIDGAYEAHDADADAVVAGARPRREWPPASADRCSRGPRPACPSRAPAARRRTVARR